MSHQYKTIGDTVYFYFASNDTSGSGGDGATPLFDVREAGAAASAAPLLSGTPTLLTHADYPAGCYEVAVSATVGNGFAADDTFAVFCTLAIDSQNPTGFIGSCTLTPLAKEGTLNTKIPNNLNTTALGNIGIDYANVENPTSANNLSGTTVNLVNTVTDVTNLHASAATSANQTTMLNRLGAFTGSGVNTILGFFQALMRSDGTDPSDLGGTYAAADDSNQAIGDKVALDSTVAKETTVTARTKLAAEYFDHTTDQVDLNTDQSGVTIGTVNNVTGLVAGSGGISTAAESVTITTAGTPVNSYTDTRTEDGTYHQIPPSAGNTDFYYQFDIGNSGVPQTVTWLGYAQSNGDTYTIYAYNYNTTTYESVGSISAANGTTPVTQTFDLLTDHVGTGVDAGKVRFRVLSTDGTLFATDRLFCTYTQAASGIPNGSTITLTSTSTNQNFIGNGWLLDLNGQTISGSYFYHAVSVTGTGVMANGTGTTFQECNIGTATLSAYGFVDHSVFSSTLTLASTAGGADDSMVIIESNSGVAGAGSPTIDASGVAKNLFLQNRGWHGGVTYFINSFVTLSHEVDEGGTITITNAGGTAEIRGGMKAFVLTSSGAATTNAVCESGAPITVNGTGGTLNLYGFYDSITDNSGGSVTINTLGQDITDIPTTAEFEARTILSANYATSSAQTTTNTHLTDIKGTGFVTDTHSLPQCLTATGFATEAKQDAAAAINTEARLSELDPANIPADVDAINAKTVNLPADPASETNVNANETKIDTLITNLATVDTNVDSILTDTGTTLPGQLNSLLGGTIQANTSGSILVKMLDAAEAPVVGVTVTGQRALDSATLAPVTGTFSGVTNARGETVFNYVAADTAATEFGLWVFSAIGADDTELEFLVSP